MTSRTAVKALLHSRSTLKPEHFDWRTLQKQADEGGCGVIGIACSEQIAGRHLLQALIQMRNRGNGKGGGVAAAGLIPEEFGVDREILENDYLLAIAYLDTSSRQEVEQSFIEPFFDLDHINVPPCELTDSLDIRPPTVVQYFVRVKPAVREHFRHDHALSELDDRQVEDEFVYQNSFELNRTFYAATGSSRAFVLSHGKNLLVYKMVGYGDDVVHTYRLEDIHAHVWIGHHRYPTKGKVWHPGGAHPFVGLNEALVHNGDFANYYSIAEYLSQRHVYPLFLTDTEVSVQVFDLLYRTYGYPLEYVIEALAPTTERDFTLLPPEKQTIYEMLQTTHIHASPDGPWFFLIAQSDREQEKPVFRLTGITDTSMLRPQVFALQDGGADGPAIGFAASEKQAIDAALLSLAGEDPRFWGRADRYWNARGGSYTDGGAFIFSVHPETGGKARLVCTDKFGHAVEIDSRPASSLAQPLPGDAPDDAYNALAGIIADGTYDEVGQALDGLMDDLHTQADADRIFSLFTRLLDHRCPSNHLRRSRLLALVDAHLAEFVKRLADRPPEGVAFFNVMTPCPDALEADQLVVIDGLGFEPEGPDSLARQIACLWESGCRCLVIVNARGHRFIGNGLGPNSEQMQIDVFGSPGDYLASGIDGLTITVHGSGQDQLAQIMKSGRLIVHGDVGQTFMYGAKGGEAYVLGNAAGRPLINAVGHPRVVINGTCLDYLAESFMAGDPLQGGGFVILNGIELDGNGHIHDLDTPYPGSNLFSLASGGALFIRDPYGKVSDDQLNGGKFVPLTAPHWDLIQPYLAENAVHFNILVESLLTVDGDLREPADVYRLVVPRVSRELQAEEAWVRANFSSGGEHSDVSFEK